jgi:hypothetical protein
LLCVEGVAAPAIKDLKCFLLVTGTFVLWKVIDPDGPDERVKHEDDEAVKVFVSSDDTGDDVADAQAVAIMSRFLLTKVGEEPVQGEDAPALLNKARRLLKKGRGGLLQVAGIERKSVKPPPPSTD